MTDKEKIKKLTKKTRLKEKLDKLLQQVYVPKNPKCYVCGRPTSEMHHFVQKRRSNRLRYEPNNLIPLCKSCHCKHHQSGDPAIHAIITKKKGWDWIDWIIETRRKHFKDTIGNLNHIEQKLKEKL